MRRYTELRDSSDYNYGDNNDYSSYGLVDLKASDYTEEDSLIASGTHSYNNLNDDTPQKRYVINQTREKLYKALIQEANEYSAKYLTGRDKSLNVSLIGLKNYREPEKQNKSPLFRLFMTTLFLPLELIAKLIMIAWYEYRRRTTKNAKYPNISFLGVDYDPEIGRWKFFLNVARRIFLYPFYLIRDIAKILWFKIRRSSHKDKVKTVLNTVISLPFSLGCGLTVMGSFLTAMTSAAFGMAIGSVLLPAGIMLLITSLVNWRIMRQKVPDVVSAIFFGIPFRALFKYSPEQYAEVLKEYYAKLDDDINQLRRRLRRLKESAGNYPDKKMRALMDSLDKELNKKCEQRSRGKVPSRWLPPLKFITMLLCTPLDIVGGAIFGIITVEMARESLFEALKVFVPAFELLGPPGWLIGFSWFLGGVTAIAMAAVFIFGTSNLIKVRNPFSKAKNYVLDLFRTVTQKKTLSGKNATKVESVTYKQEVTKKSFTKGFVVALGLTALIGLVTFGQVYAMIGGGNLFFSLDLFQTAFGAANAVISKIIIPIAATVALLPFYWLSSMIMGKTIISEYRDYFRNQTEVFHKRIVMLELLRDSHQIGPKQAQIQIDALERAQAAYTYELGQLSEKSFNLPIGKILAAMPDSLLKLFNVRDRLDSEKLSQRTLRLIPYGKLVAKLPHWVRNLVSFQLPRIGNAIGNSFISFFGAATSMGIIKADVDTPNELPEPVNVSSQELTLLGLTLAGGAGGSAAAGYDDRVGTGPFLELEKNSKMHRQERAKNRVKYIKMNGFDVGNLPLFAKPNNGSTQVPDDFGSTDSLFDRQFAYTQVASAV